jgi:glycosyltransferase involved in cell wall biosynthesis
MSETREARRSVVLVHPTGNANVRQAALALSEADALAAFHTTIAWHPGSAFDRLLPAGLRTELARRSYPGIPEALVHAHSWRELVRLLAARKGWRNLTRHETGPFCMDAICAALDRSVARSVAQGPAPDAVYAYDDCAIESFRIARQRGAASIYELPIGYLRVWRDLRNEEIEREPLWGQSIAAGADSEAKLARKDAEIAAADRVIVPSRFVADSLKGSPARNIVIVPYGCPAVAPARPGTMSSDARPVGPLRVLYVGAISQRKGIGYLLRAMRQLGGVAQLTVVGRFANPSAELAAELNRHSWTPTLPHAQVLKAMCNHDVLVLPTLFEGRALVVLEALSQGLPVVTTPNSGTEDVVLDGVSGFIVPIRSAEAIAASLTRLADDRGLLAEMSQAASRMAAACTWERYRALLLAAIFESLPQRGR